MMRIIGGTHRSRKLEVPQDDAVRPTGDKVREALFSMLSHRLGTWDEAVVLDACCGSGALGLEAISRGAGKAYFMDTSTHSLALARRNAEMLREEDKCRFMTTNITRPTPAEAQCDVILMDAPYNKGLTENGLAALTEAGWASAACIAGIEVARAESFTAPAGWRIEREREHGPARLILLERIVTA
mgnify:FL=1